MRSYGSGRSILPPSAAGPGCRLLASCEPSQTAPQIQRLRSENRAFEALARRISPIPLNLLGPEHSIMHLGGVAGNVQRVPKEPVLLQRHPQSVTGGHSYSDILKELDRIRNSKAMKGCDRLVQLVTFVVEATLKGEQAHLKETTIGVFVFGRSPDYNPKVDTIVRSQAWRLRAKLKIYYASEGLHDPVIIDLPVGKYVPVFRRGCKNND
jgi:hypothetical protein